jgi:tetraacyldisaccharide 4'-kinase
MRKNETIRIRDKTEVLLVTGIANPAPLKELLDEYSHTFELMHYPDHHIFSIDDWKDIRKRFERMENTDRLILTTEKDATRLVKFGQELENFPIYVIPLAHHFLFGEEDQFVEVSRKFIEGSPREKTSTIKQEYGQKEF